MQKAPWCVLNKVKLTEAGYRCAFWEHAPFTKHVTKKLVSCIKAETVTDKLSQPVFTASPWSAPWFPRCHSGLPRRESSAFPAWHLRPRHSEEEALHSQVLGGRVEKSQPFQRFFKRKIISEAVLQDLLSSSQDWQCWGLGMSTLGTVWSSALSSIQSKCHWQVFPGASLWPSNGGSESSEEKLTWAGWRICTGSGQWWGRTPPPPRPWRRGFVPPSPTRVARRSGSPLVDTTQRSGQNGSTRDHGPSSNSPLFQGTPMGVPHDKEKMHKGVTTVQAWFRGSLGETYCDSVPIKVSEQNVY